MLARSYGYWPPVEADIVKLVRNCATCAQQAKDLLCACSAVSDEKTELQSWPKPLTPRARVHADFAGLLDGNFYLVIVDAFSKWREIIQMNPITTSATIRVSSKVFAQFGNPKTLITDNDTFKGGLTKLKGEEPTAEALQAFLAAHRSTSRPSGPNHLSLAENFLGRRIRTGVGLMIPSSKDSRGRRDTKMKGQFNRHQGAKACHFDVDDAVFAKDYRQVQTIWTPGIMARRLGNVMYHVRCGNALWTRHATS
uniref:Integrase catalytic domain-containing protein n=1 Tax=Haemonchus contortus TaxID=6289 RepID=A0A7I5E5S7_HAECO